MLGLTKKIVKVPLLQARRLEFLRVGKVFANYGETLNSSERQSCI